MKSLKRIKLNHLNDEELLEREMDQIRGGNDRTCSCRCIYENSGGSTTVDNAIANTGVGESGGYSPGGEKVCTAYYENLPGHYCEANYRW